jgi:hypothetical protein
MKRILLITAATLACMTPALADNTDTETVTVSGTVVAPLELTATNLAMPHLVRRGATDAADTSVTLACAAADANNTVTYGGNGNPFADGNAAGSGTAATSANAALVGVATAAVTGTCASLTTTGETNYSFQISFGAITQPTGATISAPTCYVGGTAIVAAAPVVVGAAVQCGATVTAAATVGNTYTGTIPVTVTYD